MATLFKRWITSIIGLSFLLGDGYLIYCRKEYSVSLMDFLLLGTGLILIGVQDTILQKIMALLGVIISRLSPPVISEAQRKSVVEPVKDDSPSDEDDP